MEEHSWSQTRAGPDDPKTGRPDQPGHLHRTGAVDGHRGSRRRSQGSLNRPDSRGVSHLSLDDALRYASTLVEAGVDGRGDRMTGQVGIVGLGDIAVVPGLAVRIRLDRAHLRPQAGPPERRVAPTRPRRRRDAQRSPTTAGRAANAGVRSTRVTRFGLCPRTRQPPVSPPPSPVSCPRPRARDAPERHAVGATGLEPVTSAL